MLVLREFKQTAGNLWIYDVFHGSYRMGRLEPVHVSDGWKKKLEGWDWRLTPFCVNGPDGVPCYGRADNQSAALADQISAWQRFIDTSEMAAGILRLRPQPDHAAGLADNYVYAGTFLLGRVYQHRTLLDVGWRWLIMGLSGYAAAGAVDRDDAMVQIKAAWRCIYAQIQSEP